MSTKRRQRPEQTDGLAALHRRYVEGDPQMERLVEEAREELCLADRIHTMRKERGISQEALAKQIGTSRTAIGRLEDPSYHSHSLTTLRRVARALGHRVQVDFVPIAGERPRARTRKKGKSTKRASSRRSPAKR